MLRWKIIAFTLLCALLIEAEEVEDLKEEIGLEDLGELFLDESQIGAQLKVDINGIELNKLIKSTQKKVDNAAKEAKSLSQEVDTVSKMADDVLALAKYVATASAP